MGFYANEWISLARGIITAYLDARLYKLFYSCNSSGFAQYLQWKHDGDPRFGPSDYHLFAIKNMHGDEHAARELFDMRSEFLINKWGRVQWLYDRCCVRPGSDVMLHLSRVDDGRTIGHADVA
ncbi:MAG: hypothetical protein AAFQ77_04075, partial [Myxococcota bacterium]